MVSIPASLGRIVSRDGYSYQITPNDLLWLARSVHKEGGDYASTIWTYFQLQAAARRTSSLASLVLAHSQPVNPAWRADGEFCRPGGRYAAEDNCAPRLLEQRAANAVRPWEQIPVAVRDLVVRAATARLANPVPRAINFADPTVSANFLARPANAGSGIVRKAGNWYLYEARSANWPVDFVRVAHGGVSSGVAAAAGGIGLALALGLGAYMIVRWQWRS